MRHVVGSDKPVEIEENITSNSGDDNEDEEESYFMGYAHFSIHHDMLADKVFSVFCVNF